MELPRVLAPWAEYLQLFPRELMLALGPIVRRLDTVIGPLRAQGRRGDGDPDGFDGLTRRGSYERLLLSEWLLAEEVPEEFVRRAAMQEHGFLHLARREPVGSRVSVALFDAGPNQMGAPRLAHLAALLVLARRADAGGASFWWGVLQQPSLYSAVTPASVQALLDARCIRETTAEDIQAWRERLGVALTPGPFPGRSFLAGEGVTPAWSPVAHTQRKQAVFAEMGAASNVPTDATTQVTPFPSSALRPKSSGREREPLSVRWRVGTGDGGLGQPGLGSDDLWFIGGRRIGPMIGTQNVSLLVIGDPLEPETRTLTADVCDRGRVRPTATLELPEDALCVRLLRDPFRTATAEPQRATNRYARPTSNLIFTDYGRRLIARSGPEHLVAYPVPNTPSAQVGKPKVYSVSAGASIVAAGRGGRGYMLLTTTLEPNVLRWERVGPKGGQCPTGTLRIPSGVEIPTIEADTPLYPLFMQREYDYETSAYSTQYLMVLNGYLLRLPCNDETSIHSVHLEASNVTTFDYTPYQYHCYHWLEQTPNGGGVYHVQDEDGPRETHAVYPRLYDACFGYSGRSWCVAIETETRLWTVVLNKEETERIYAPIGATVVGLYGRSREVNDEYRHYTGLILLDQNRTQLTLKEKDRMEDILRASAPIVQMGLSNDEPRLAYLTSRGELVIYDLSESQTLYRLETEGVEG